MNSFNFNSAVCTSIEQSRKLLSLGLKKETADMSHIDYGGRNYMIRPFDWQFISKVDMENFIPAWSLHRLIEMINIKIQFRLKERTTNIYGISHIHPFQSFSGFGIDGKSYYNSIINAIEWLIKEGYFNNEYLI